MSKTTPRFVRSFAGANAGPSDEALVSRPRKPKGMVSTRSQAGTRWGDPRRFWSNGQILIYPANAGMNRSIQILLIIVEWGRLVNTQRAYNKLEAIACLQKGESKHTNHVRRLFFMIYHGLKTCFDPRITNHVLT